MPKIQWTNDFSVGNDEIDEQHKKWIEIFNEAHDKMLGNLPPEEKRDIGRDTLEKMIQYVNYHFSFEEKLMAESGFSNISAHRVIHADFSRKLEQMADQLRQGEYILNSEIIKTIENWLIHHILTEDKKIFS